MLLAVRVLDCQFDWLAKVLGGAVQRGVIIFGDRLPVDPRDCCAIADQRKVGREVSAGLCPILRLNLVLGGRPQARRRGDASFNESLTTVGLSWDYLQVDL